MVNIQERFLIKSGLQWRVYGIFEEGYIYLLWIPWQYWSLAPPVCEQNFRSAFAFSHTANIIQCPKYSVFQCTLLHLGHSIAAVLCTSVPYVPSILGQLLDLISSSEINIFEPRLKSYDPWDPANWTASVLQMNTKDQNIF